MLAAIKAAFSAGSGFLSTRGAAEALLTSLAEDNPDDSAAWGDVSADSVRSWFARQRGIGKSSSAAEPEAGPDEPADGAAAADEPRVPEGAARKRSRRSPQCGGLPAGPLGPFSPRTAKRAKGIAGARKNSALANARNVIHRSFLRLGENFPGVIWVFGVKAPLSSGGHGQLTGDAGGVRWNSDEGYDDVMSGIGKSDKKLARMIQRGEMQPHAFPERERRHVNASGKYANSGSTAYLVYQAVVRSDTVASLVARNMPAGHADVAAAMAANWRALSSEEKETFAGAMPSDASGLDDDFRGKLTHLLAACFNARSVTCAAFSVISFVRRGPRVEF